MTQYQIIFDGAQDAAEQLSGIRLALEDYASKLNQLAKDGQEGLESISESIAQWAHIVQERADDTFRASDCLTDASCNYYDAEKLVHELLLEVDSTVVEGDDVDSETVVIGNDGDDETREIDGWVHEASENEQQSDDSERNDRNDHISYPIDSSNRPIVSNSTTTQRNDDPIYTTGDFRGAETDNSPLTQWDNTPTEGIDWERLTSLTDWREILPLLFAFVISAGNAPADVWRFIQGLINQGFGVGSESASNMTGDEGSDDDWTDNSGMSSNVATGTGVIDRPEEHFADAESDVNAQMGQGILSNDGYESGALGSSQSGWGNASGGSSGHYSGGDEEYGGTTPAASGTAGSEFVGGVVGGGNTRPNLEGDGDAISAEPSPLSEDTQETLENASWDSASPLHGPSGQLSSEKGTLNTGEKLAAPLIGVASAVSMVSSGMGIREKLKKDKADKSDDEQPDQPVVTAKESNGVFSGNLKGEYVILASALSLLFTGTSISAAVHVKKKKRKPDDLFRVGNGVSAILSGGTIQERG